MSAETIKDAYHEGYNEGQIQAHQYDLGRTLRPALECWEESEAKAELDKTNEEKS